MVLGEDARQAPSAGKRPDPEVVPIDAVFPEGRLVDNSCRQVLGLVRGGHGTESRRGLSFTRNVPRSSMDFGVSVVHHQDQAVGAVLHQRDLQRIPVAVADEGGGIAKAAELRESYVVLIHAVAGIIRRVGRVVGVGRAEPQRLRESEVGRRGLLGQQRQGAGGAGAWCGRASGDVVARHCGHRLGKFIVARVPGLTARDEVAHALT